MWDWELCKEFEARSYVTGIKQAGYHRPLVWGPSCDASGTESGDPSHIFHGLRHPCPCNSIAPSPIFLLNRTDASSVRHGIPCGETAGVRQRAIVEPLVSSSPRYTIRTIQHPSGFSPRTSVPVFPSSNSRFAGCSIPIVCFSPVWPLVGRTGLKYQESPYR
ncbi:hypothetical protein VTK73DRAFT_2900 [Phialemonium thermophilum]|uniref:Uncharacterized protein n=1 Tax=Phialemonium thermophilum TaxID=223376 RepID=A0ABR3X223_9PEZI